MDIRAAFQKINQRIEDACRRSGRKIEEVTMVGVTKAHPTQAIFDSLKVGILNIGESYVQEAVRKIEEVKESLSEDDFRKIIWHFIGRLQTNKIKYLKDDFDYIHSIEKEKQLDEIDRKITSPIGIFFEINTGDEESKGGVSLDTSFKLFEKLMNINEDRASNGKPPIKPMGLMCIPPFDKDPEASRIHFARLREDLEEINSKFGTNMTCLSMGMSNDFDIAIEEGATHVRIGTLLYGERS